MKESGGWQQISVSAGDRAGNQMEELQMEILVSSSILVQLMKSPAVPVLCLLGASASAGAAAAFVIRRRKRLKKNRERVTEGTSLPGMLFSRSEFSCR